MDRKLIVYVNGHKLMETEDDVGALEELPGSHPGIMASYRGGIATGQFKDVEFQYLD